MIVFVKQLKKHMQNKQFKKGQCKGKSGVV